MSWSIFLQHMLAGERKVDGDAVNFALTPPRNIELKHLPNAFSMSAFLSPSLNVNAGLSRLEQVRLTINGTQLDSTHLILLALNEECRSIAKGALYHLPLRGQDLYQGNACDLVYLPDGWNERDKTAWDQGSWEERLTMCQMGVAKLESSEMAIPICARILQLANDVNGSSHLLARRISNDSGDGSVPSPSRDRSPDTSTKDQVGEQGSNVPLIVVHDSDSSTSDLDHYHLNTPTAQRDPAVKLNKFSYSRPMEDISSYLILYSSHSATPIVCATTAFEHHSLCGRRPTPGDLSETFEFGPEFQGNNNMESPGSENQRQTASMAARRVLSSGMSSNLEVVETLWKVWHENCDGISTVEQDWLGRVKWSCEEVKTIIDGAWNKAEGLPAGWPV